MRSAAFTNPITIDSLTAAKAFGISLVVINHACGDDLLLHGGLNVLLLISGIHMASFAFNGTTRQTLGAFRSYTLRIVIPSVLLALAWNVAVNHVGGGDVPIKLTELLLFSNWISPDRVALFPIWFIQIIFQMMIVLSLVFWMFDLTPRIRKAPVKVTMIAFVVTLVVAMTSLALWDTTYLADKLPHLLAWNFIFGWVYWAVAVIRPKTNRNRIILSLMLVISEILVFEIGEPFDGDVRIFSLTALGFFIIWIDSISLPAILARAVLLVSQATFYIFLFHYYGFWLAMRIGKVIGMRDLLESNGARIAVGIVLPVLLWMVVTAGRRAYKKTVNRSSTADPTYSPI